MPYTLWDIQKTEKKQSTIVKSKKRKLSPVSKSKPLEVKKKRLSVKHEKIKEHHKEKPKKSSFP